MGILKKIEYERMKEIVENISDSRTKAMVCTQYGLGARAGELVEYKHTNGKVTCGLLKSNIFFRNGIYFFYIPNFKNVKKSFKTPFILPSEKWVFEPIKDWLMICNEQVFDLKISRFRQLVDSVLPDGFLSHALRHSRASHLSEIFGFSAFEIQNFLGHARLDTSAVYVHSDLTKTAKKMEVILNEYANSNFVSNK